MMQPGAAAGADSRSSGSSKSLQAKAADPTEPLVQMSVFNDLVASSHGGDGAANRVLIQPVIPLRPFDWFPLGQILRPSIPIITTPGPDRVTGLGDITLFDVFLPERERWGAWGFGPVFVFPSATDHRLGQGKWQLGPAAAVMYDAIPHVQLGVIVQNPISYAGSAHRDDANALLLQPIGQYNFARGWYASIGDFTWTFDWKEDGAATIPLALQVGRVVDLLGQKWNLAIEGTRTVVHHGPAPQWGVRFGFSLLLPEKL